MAQAQKGLGRGLEALLGGYQEEETTKEGMTLPLDAIRPNPEQPRRMFNDAALAELAASIKEQGLLQPVLVRPVTAGGGVSHEIVAGERRWRAARMAGLREIPVLVRELTDAQSLALALIENLQREDLNPMEEASGLHLLQSRFGMSQEELAHKVGKSRSAVANALRLLQLSEPIRADIENGAITPGHARALLSLSDEAVRDALWQAIGAQGLSVRQTEDLAAYAKAHGTLPEADFPRALPVKAGRRETRKAPDAGLRDIEGALFERVGVVVKTKGTAEHGRITFVYNSRSELEGLLGHFGLECEAPAEQGGQG